MPSEIDSSEFRCRNEDCPDYGKKQNGNIVLKESYGKQNRMLLQCKTCQNCFSQGTMSFGCDAPHEVPITLAIVPEKESIRGATRATGHEGQINLTNSSKQYTKEELLLRLQGKARELGRTPKCKDLNEDPEMPSVYTYYTKFGSITKALKEAGLTPNKVGRRKKYSDLELLDILRSKARSIGRIPTSEDVDADSSMPSYTTYQYHFGSFQEAIRKAELRPIIKHHIQHSKVDLPSRLIEKTKTSGHNTTPKAGDDPDISVRVFRYPSCSIKNPIREAGLMRHETGRYSRYTKEDLLNMLKEKAKELGRIPTQNELNSDPDMPSFSTYVYRFGSFQSVCKKVGLLPRKHGRSVKYTDTELLDMLRNKAKELGRPLGWDDLGKYNKMPARQIYTIRFGGLRKAMKKAGIL